MAEQEPGGAAAAVGAPEAHLLINTQYIKDLSFENPNAPASFTEMKEGPDITVNIDVTAGHLGGRIYEVVLTAKAEAKVKDKTAFIVELAFAGIVTVGEKVSEAEASPLLLVETPRFLFPFARNVIAEVTRQGGFPPLLINPVDFGQLYQRQREAATQATSPVG